MPPAETLPAIAWTERPSRPPAARRPHRHAIGFGSAIVCLLLPAAAMAGERPAVSAGARPAGTAGCQAIRWSWGELKEAPPEVEMEATAPRNAAARDVERIAGSLGINMAPSRVCVHPDASRSFYAIWKDRQLHQWLALDGAVDRPFRLPPDQVRYLGSRQEDLARLRERLRQGPAPKWNRASVLISDIRMVLLTDAVLSLLSGGEEQALDDLATTCRLLAEIPESAGHQFSAIADLVGVAEALRRMPSARPCPWTERLRAHDFRTTVLGALDAEGAGLAGIDSLPFEDGTTWKAALGVALRPYTRACSRNAATVWRERVAELVRRETLCGADPPDFRASLLDSVPGWNRAAPALLLRQADSAELLLSQLARLEWELELTDRVLELRGFAATSGKHVLPPPVPSAACSGATWHYAWTRDERIRVSLQPEPAWPPRSRGWTGTFVLILPRN